VLILPGTELINAGVPPNAFARPLASCALRMGPQELHFTISTGVAEVMPGDDMYTLITRTAAALGASIDSGGNCTYFHDGLTREQLRSTAGINRCPVSRAAQHCRRVSPKPSGLAFDLQIQSGGGSNG